MNLAMHGNRVNEERGSQLSIKKSMIDEGEFIHRLNESEILLMRSTGNKGDINLTEIWKSRIKLHQLPSSQQDTIEWKILLQLQPVNNNTFSGVTLSTILETPSSLLKIKEAQSNWPYVVLMLSQWYELLNATIVVGHPLV